MDQAPTAAKYRKLAQETRAMAQGVMPEEHRKSLLAIAETYDRLASVTGGRSPQRA